VCLAIWRGGRYPTYGSRDYAGFERVVGEFVRGFVGLVKHVYGSGFAFVCLFFLGCWSLLKII
jgi:hypothetical protein